MLLACVCTSWLFWADWPIMHIYRRTFSRNDSDVNLTLQHGLKLANTVLSPWIKRPPLFGHNAILFYKASERSAQRQCSSLQTLSHLRDRYVCQGIDTVEVSCAGFRLSLKSPKESHAMMVLRRLLRKRWVLGVVFGLSLIYFLTSTLKQVQKRTKTNVIYCPRSGLMWI